MIKRVILFLAIVLACISCFAYFRLHDEEHLGLSKEKIREMWSHANPQQVHFRSGDLIFRHGRGAISEALKLFSRHDAAYSHAGIISIENKKVFVYHAIGGEENPTNHLRKDPLELFCNPNNVHSFGMYRLDLDNDKFRKVDSLASVYFRKGLEFDTKFDLNTDDKMYCSEFVYKVILKVTGDKNYLPLSAVSGMKYVACDDLYLNPHCSCLYRYQY